MEQVKEVEEINQNHNEPASIAETSYNPCADCRPESVPGYGGECIPECYFCTKRTNADGV